MNDKGRWGSSPCSVQACWTGMWLLPRGRASNRVDQWVLPRGFSEVVARRTRCTRRATGAVASRCAVRSTEVPPVGAGRSADTRRRECGDGFREPLRSDLSISPGPRQGRSAAEDPPVRGRAIVCPAPELAHLSGNEDHENGDPHEPGKGVRMNALSCQ